MKFVLLMVPIPKYMVPPSHGKAIKSVELQWDVGDGTTGIHRFGEHEIEAVVDHVMPAFTAGFSAHGDER